MLRNLEASFQFTFGSPDDPRLIHDLKVAGRAAQVRRRLRSARIGLLPSPNEQMQVNFVDESRLAVDLGPTVQYLTVSEYRRVVDALSRVRVEAYLQQVSQRFNVQDVSPETLRIAAQAALGLAHLALDHRLDVLAISDTSLELKRSFGMRPALYPDLLEPLPVLFQPEGDLGAATANYILHHLTGSATMFVEMWFWDEPRNQVICGHSGVQNPLLAEENTAWISPDYEIQHSDLREGAQFQFIARSGRVTLFQLRSTPKSWQAIALTGMCLEGRPWVRGYPHALLRLDSTIEHFLNNLSTVGASQHWILAYGSVIEELESLCQMANIPLAVLTS
jgi:L-arabinose isomerase